MKKTLVFLCVVFLLILAGLAHAQLTNYDFETGDLSGWETVGEVNIETEAFGTGPTEGDYQALLTTGPGAVSGEDLEPFHELYSEKSWWDLIVAGSFMQQTFSVADGGALIVDYNFFKHSDSPSWGAYLWGVLSSEGYKVKIGLQINKSFVPSSSTQFEEEIGWITKVLGLYGGGTWSLKFGVFDFYDANREYGFLIDNIKLIEIDFMPGNKNNHFNINPRKKGRIPVAILSNETFDASSVDPETCHLQTVFVSTFPDHSALEDVDGDGDLDMIMHYKETGLDCQNTDFEMCCDIFGGLWFCTDILINPVGCK